MKKLSTFKKALVLLVAVLSGMASVNAATITVSSAPESAGVNYNTIQAAYDYIKALDAVTPISEAYVIEIQSTYTGEAAYPLSLTAIAGATDVNTITIRPATGAKITIAAPNQTIIAPGMNFDATTTSLVLTDVSGLSTTSYVSGQGTYASAAFKQLAGVDEGTKTVTFAAGTFVATKTNTTLFLGAAQTKTIDLNAAKYVIIDGVSRTDANTGLTISNPNCIFSQTIYLQNNAQYNTIKNCIIRGANQTGAWQAGYNGTVYFAGSSHNTLTLNDVCDMDSETIPMPIAVFQMTGVGANFENIISENNVYNISNFIATNGNPGFFQFGSTYNTASNNNSVLNNKMFWTKTTKISGSNVVGIGVGGSMQGLGNRFEGNVIGYASANGTGTSVLDATGATIKLIANLRNFTCKNNTVANIEMTGSNLTGFEFGASNASTPNADDVCYGNTVKDIKLSTTANGTLQAFLISVANPYHFNVKNNIIRNLTIENKTGDNTLNIYGFQYTGTYVAGNSYQYVNNEVSNLSCGLGTVPSTKAGNAYGIRANIVDMIEKNLVYSINANTQAYIRGFRIEGNNTNPIVFRNNIIRLGTEVTGNASIIAIQYNTTSAMNIYHNTVYVGGQCASDAPNTILTRILSYFTGSPVLSMQNNIFSNKRSGGASLNSILLTSAGKVAVSDHNLYEYNGEYFKDAAAYVDLTAWKTAMPALEAGSLDNVDPGFADATGSIPDLHLPTNSPADHSGVVIASVTDDFNGYIRADFTPADMGAHVIAGSTDVESFVNEQLRVYAINNQVVFNQLKGQKATIYTLTGQIVKSMELQSDYELQSLPAGVFVIRVATQTTRVFVR